jgi:hypothetical protein
MTLLSEGQVGDCGDDWAYDLDVKVFHEGLKGEGGFSVPKHNLSSDVVQEPHGSPAPVVLYTGDCSGHVQIKMLLTATEVDAFVNDVGKVSKDLTLECPGSSGHPVIRDVDIAAGVRESPGIRNKNSVFTLRVRFSLTNSG